MTNVVLTCFLFNMELIPPLHIVLFEPEIPPNTGNIARTCAALGAKLHLIEPLGFSLSERALKRAGLDYWHLVDVSVYSSLCDFNDHNSAGQRFYFSKKGAVSYHKVKYTPGCFLFFGKETRGLPLSLLRENSERTLRIPMVSEARSLNLSNAAAIAAYEAMRQLGYPGLTP